MGKFRNIIFDFDGTLVDTAPLILATMQATIRELDLPARSEIECQSTIGLRLEEIPSVLWPDHPEVNDKYPATYRHIFDEIKQTIDIVCYPGVLDTLKTLHESGYAMAIASSRSRKSLEEYVLRFGISDYFTMLIGGNDVSHGKPSPEPVMTILDRCGWKDSETLTVGDAPVDIIMGNKAGTATCAVTYGNGKTETLIATAPTYIISAFPALLSIVNSSDEEE